MAALADLAAYLTKLEAPHQIVPQSKGAFTAIAGRPTDMWAVNALAGAAPTTAVVPTNTTAGSMLQQDAGPEQLYALGGSLGLPGGGTAILCDRLSHQGGLSGTVTTVGLTTNLPTAALTRYTTGEGVHLAISISGQIGTSSTTISCSYTNQAGTGSRTSAARVIGNTNFREAARWLQIPLQAGDTGVRSVQSTTLAATTGTAGAFGYVLYRPLVAFTVERTGTVVDFNIFDGGMTGGIPAVQDGACLFWLRITQITTAGIVGSLNLTAV